MGYSQNVSNRLLEVPDPLWGLSDQKYSYICANFSFDPSTNDAK